MEHPGPSRASPFVGQLGVLSKRMQELLDMLVLLPVEAQDKVAEAMQGILNNCATLLEGRVTSVSVPLDAQRMLQSFDE
jgi:hypothetical protein